jgi:hypothetical protein
MVTVLNVMTRTGSVLTGNGRKVGEVDERTCLQMDHRL